MKERLNWIDALRGFTMFSVVAVHVLTFGFGVKPDNSVLCVLRGAFTLPLFFLVSGYFLYRPAKEWTKTRLWKTLKVRFVAMVIGSFFFATIFMLTLKPQNALEWLPSGYSGRYWFTYTLFQMFVYYILFVGVARLIKRSILIPMFVVAFAAPIVMNFIPALADGFWANWAINKHTVIYFQFVLAGMLIRKYQEVFFKYLMKPATLTILIVGFLVSCGLFMIPAAESGIGAYSALFKSIYYTAGRYCGAFLIFNIFYYNKEFFNGTGRGVRYWRKVGMRTLDIYYLHYFLLPKMYWVRPYISKGNTMLPELILAFTGAFIIVFLCVALSNLLRRAPLIRNLFGAKN